MARNLLDLIQTKLPTTVSPYDGMLGIQIAESYYDLYRLTGRKSDLEAARRIVRAEIPRWAQLVRYAQSLSPERLALLGGSELNGLQYLSAAIALANRIDVLAALERNPANVDLIASWSPRPGFDASLRMAPLLYVSGHSAADLEEAAESYSGAQRAAIDVAIATARAHEAAGIPAMALSDSVMAEYSIDPRAWIELLRY